MDTTRYYSGGFSDGMFCRPEQVQTTQEMLLSHACAYGFPLKMYKFQVETCFGESNVRLLIALTEEESKKYFNHTEV